MTASGFYSGLGQSPPGKMLTRVTLAVMGHIRMREHPLRPNAPAFNNIMAKRYDGFDLHRRIIWQSLAMSPISDFDPYRNIIHIALAGPNTPARVPSSSGFRHELREAAILPDEIMRRHFCCWITQLPQSSLAIRQTG